MQTDRQADKQTETLWCRQTGYKADRHADRHADWQAD